MGSSERVRCRSEEEIYARVTVRYAGVSDDGAGCVQLVSAEGSSGHVFHEIFSLFIFFS